MKKILFAFLLVFSFTQTQIVSAQTLPDIGDDKIPVVNCAQLSGTCKSFGSIRSDSDACDNTWPYNDGGPEDYVGYCSTGLGGSDNAREDCCVPSGSASAEEIEAATVSQWIDEDSVCEAPRSEGGYEGECRFAASGLDPTDILTGSGQCGDDYPHFVGTCGTFGGNAVCCVKQETADEITGGTLAPSIEYGDYQLLEQIPGSSNTSGELKPYLESIYKAGFVLIVIGAIFMIGFGGFTYMASAGNTSMIKKGKGMITDAIIGLVVALLIWLILNIINPDLVNLSIDPLPGVEFTSGNIGLENANLDSQNGTQSGARATNCPSPLVAMPRDIELKGGTNMICPELLSKLQQLKSVNGWRVTRLTGGGAQSQCHKTGTGTTGSCADVAFHPNPGFNDPAWDPLCEAAARLTGVRVLNEASNSPTCQRALGTFKRTPNQTGAHLHIDYNGS